MKRVENQKKASLTPSSGLQRNLKRFFLCANSRSKIIAIEHCAYASKDKMVRIWPTLKKNYFFISSLKVPNYRDFMT
jgi:hypothetical protein